MLVSWEPYDGRAAVRLAKGKQCHQFLTFKKEADVILRPLNFVRFCGSQFGVCKLNLTTGLPLLAQNLRCHASTISVPDSMFSASIRGMCSYDAEGHYGGNASRSRVVAVYLRFQIKHGASDAHGSRFRPYSPANFPKFAVSAVVLYAVLDGATQREHKVFATQVVQF